MNTQGAASCCKTGWTCQIFTAGGGRGTTTTTTTTTTVTKSTTAAPATVSCKLPNDPSLKMQILRRSITTVAPTLKVLCQPSGSWANNGHAAKEQLKKGRSALKLKRRAAPSCRHSVLGAQANGEERSIRYRFFFPLKAGSL